MQQTSVLYRVGASAPVGWMVELVGWLTLKGLSFVGRFLDRLLPDETMPPQYVAYREDPTDPWGKTELIPLNRNDDSL